MEVDEKTLEIQSYVEVVAWGDYEKVHFLDTGKLFGSREEYNKWLKAKKKKEAAKKAKEAPEKAPETAPVETSEVEDTPEPQEV